jgi:hypothetical protein
MTVTVNLLLKSDDGALIKIRYESRRKDPKEAIGKIQRHESLAPSEYYLRATAFFETTDPRYAWLNDIVAVGYGRTEPGAGVFIRLYELK